MQRHGGHIAIAELPYCYAKTWGAPEARDWREGVGEEGVERVGREERLKQGVGREGVGMEGVEGVGREERLKQGVGREERLKQGVGRKERLKLGAGGKEWGGHRLSSSGEVS